MRVRCARSRKRWPTTVNAATKRIGQRGRNRARHAAELGQAASDRSWAGARDDHGRRRADQDFGAGEPRAATAQGKWSHQLSINIAPRGAQLRREESRCRLQDRVRPTQFTDLTFQLGDPDRRIGGRPQPGTGINLGLGHPTAQGLRIDPQLPPDPGAGTLAAGRAGPGIEHQPDRPLPQLIGVLRSFHWIPLITSRRSRHCRPRPPTGSAPAASGGRARLQRREGNTARSAPRRHRSARHCPPTRHDGPHHVDRLQDTA